MFDWESQVAQVLDELSGVQSRLLELLDRKRQLIAAGDVNQLEELGPLEEKLLAELQAVSEKRSDLLEAAAGAGMPHDSIVGLTSALASEPRRRLQPSLSEAQSRTRLLRHQSVANWVLVQRSLLHLSQMLEIIATGGRGAPTYEKGGRRSSGGSLIDQAV